jgi:hypothetical protein
MNGTGVLRSDPSIEVRGRMEDGIRYKLPGFSAHPNTLFFHALSMASPYRLKVLVIRKKYTRPTRNTKVIAMRGPSIIRGDGVMIGSLGEPVSHIKDMMQVKYDIMDLVRDKVTS